MSFHNYFQRYRVEIFLGCFLFGCGLGASAGVPAGVGIGICVATLIGALFTRRRIPVPLIFLFLFALGVGSLYASIATEHGNEPQLDAYAPSVKISGTVIRDPRVWRYEQQILLALERVPGKKIDGRVLIESALTPRIHSGEHIVVTCRPEAISEVKNASYRAMLQRQGVSDLCTHATILEHTSGGASVWRIASQIRQKISSAIKDAFPSPESDLLAGILIGADQGFSDALKESFRVSGLTHIVAVSGSNITLMIFFLQTFLSSVGFSRKSGFGVLIAGVTLFTLVSGAGSSSVRAGIMGLLAISAQQLGRTSATLRIILIAASVMTLLNPLILVNDLSFQLSFIATLGLVYIAPILSRACAWIPDVCMVRTSLSQTLAAILATQPLIVFNFGTLSLIAPFTNILVVPLVPLIMGLGSVWGALTFFEWAGSILVAGIMPFSLQWVFAWPAWLLLQAVIACASFASHIPFAQIGVQISPITALIAGTCYGLVGVFLLKFRLQRTRQPS